MSPTVGVNSNWGFSCNTWCNWEQPIECGQVWSGLNGVGVIGGYDKVGWSHVGHVILEGLDVPEAV